MPQIAIHNIQGARMLTAKQYVCLLTALVAMTPSYSSANLATVFVGMYAAYEADEIFVTDRHRNTSHTDNHCLFRWIITYVMSQGVTHVIMKSVFNDGCCTHCNGCCTHCTCPEHQCWINRIQDCGDFICGALYYASNEYLKRVENEVAHD